jgi:cytochrome c oxidase subunit 3
MPTAFTHTPVKSRRPRRASGIGGKPPVTRRPTGGGGGDENWENGRKGPRELLVRFRFFVFSALSMDLMFFTVLVAIFFASHGNTRLTPHSHEPINYWQEKRLPWILYLDTALLMASCVTVEVARRNIFREIDVLEEWLGLGKPALRKALPWLGATLGLGALFVAGQVQSWKQMATSGLGCDRWVTASHSFFYVMTGLHALHLLAGLVALGLCLSTLSRLKRVEFRQIAVDSAAWYWHAMSLMWIVLQLVLVLGQ